MQQETMNHLQVQSISLSPTCTSFDNPKNTPELKTPERIIEKDSDHYEKSLSRPKHNANYICTKPLSSISTVTKQNLLVLSLSPHTKTTNSQIYKKSLISFSSTLSKYQIIVPPIFFFIHYASYTIQVDFEKVHNSNTRYSPLKNNIIIRSKTTF